MELIDELFSAVEADNLVWFSGLIAERLPFDIADFKNTKQIYTQNTLLHKAKSIPMAERLIGLGANKCQKLLGRHPSFLCGMS